MQPNNFEPIKGSTLLIPSGTSMNPSRQHLFIVLTNPCAAGQQLLISISSVKTGQANDSTCLIPAGSHPFIQTESYVFYAKPQQLPNKGIIKCVAGTLYTPKDDCDPELFKRICDGISTSPFTPRWAKEYYRVNHAR
jgi:hypothetical protein